jgi:signal transduction histidine kinase
MPTREGKMAAATASRARREVNPTSAQRRSMTLSRQFLVAGGLLMLLALAAAGFLITEMVSRGAIRSKATSTALLMESLVGPVIQRLATDTKLPPADILRLNQLFTDEALRQRFPYFEIWTPDGVVAYSNTNQIIGEAFQPSAGLKLALSGEIAADYTDPSAREHVMRGIKTRYLEIYSPIRQDGSSRIIAIAEIHEHAEPFQRELAVLRASSWAVVAAVTLLMMVSLFGIVHRGSRTIERQSASLSQRIEEAERLLEQNVQLRERSQRASARVAELNEQFIRSIGADLHDGPAQLISFSILKIGELKTGDQRKALAGRSLDIVRSALEEALREIRGVATGLLLPELNDQSLPDVLARAVRAHESRTGTVVTMVIGDALPPVSHAVKICAFRFVQEGLNNAYRHGGGLQQQVHCWVDASNLHVVVADSGTAAADFEKGLQQGRMGLYGLRERVESLGGTLAVQSCSSTGNRIQFSMPLGGGTLVD